MTQETQKNQAQKQKSSSKEESSLSEILKPITDAIQTLSKKEKIAYSLIVIGIIFIIVGVVLW